MADLAYCKVLGFDIIITPRASLVPSPCMHPMAHALKYNTGIKVAEEVSHDFRGMRI